ncbi:MAG: hypothetical protein ACXW2Q_09315, partial [Thermoanaerobaculia bacterium]
ALVPVIVRRLQTYYPSTPINVRAPVITTAPAPLRVRPRVVVVDQNYIPPFVMNRVTEVRQHPHGGPPGQIKKQLGLQTGAEVVHGERDRIDERNHGHSNGRGRDNAQVAQPQHGQDGGGNQGQQKDKGEEKDKGKGKG